MVVYNWIWHNIIVGIEKQNKVMKQEIKDLLDSITGYNPKCPSTQNAAIANYLIQQLEGFSIERAKRIFNVAIEEVEKQIITNKKED